MATEVMGNLPEVFLPTSRMGEAQAAGHLARTGHKMQTVLQAFKGEIRYFRICC